MISLGFGHIRLGLYDFEEVCDGIVVDILTMSCFDAFVIMFFGWRCCHMNQKVTL